MEDNKKEFSIKTIEEGRLSKENMNDLYGGGIVDPCSYTFNCPLHYVGACANWYFYCGPLPALTYQDCCGEDDYTGCKIEYMIVQPCPPYN